MTPWIIPGTNGWRFAFPLFLLLLALLPLLWWLWSLRSRRPVLRYSGLAAIAAVQSSFPARIRMILPILRSVALLCLILAAARPQSPDETRRIFAEGVAIELVVDVSGSMQDADLSPSPTLRMNRLDVVKQVVQRFVQGDDRLDLQGRTNDLIGMIRFARFPDAVCPLTLDHDSLLRILDELEIVTRRDENATAIGDALGLAVERLRDVERSTGSGTQLKIKSRVVILLTDGENNDGAVTPEMAGDLAAASGIKVYTILAGTGQSTGFGFRRAIDDSQLRYIAEATGGKHFRARDADALAEVYGEIDQLERTRVEERTNLRWRERAMPLLFVAFGCLSMQMFLDSTRLRKIP